MKLFPPKILLHLEGLTVFTAACVAYAIHGAAWWKFIAPFLVPDLMMLGYLFGAKVGAAVYNVGHTYSIVAIFWLIAYFAHLPHALSIGLIWTAHIGFDRLCGYGLKYSTAFKDTHLGKV
jgi:p-aminobenzoyl-glutamate transporter AbgT